LGVAPAPAPGHISLRLNRGADELWCGPGVGDVGSGELDGAEELRRGKCAYHGQDGPGFKRDTGGEWEGYVGGRAAPTSSRTG
jgi:hypothetical protein